MQSIDIDFPHKELFIKIFNGHVYAVGGFVRDLLLGRNQAPEVDVLITSHSAEEITASLKPYGKANFVGKSFGVVKFTIDKTTYDIALPRKESPLAADQRGHKDFDVKSDPDLPLEQDLKRRDFRCNSMAVRLKDGQLIDPYSGQKDIRQRVLRLTNPETFAEDPLRVLRAARFASVLNFSVDPKIYRISQSIDLSGLSHERINEELFRILLESMRPSIGLEELFRLGALKQLIPELYQLTLSIQDSYFHPEKDRFGHHTVWAHTKITVDQAKRLAENFIDTYPRKLAFLLAALFHDSGKPGTAEWGFKKGRMVIMNNRHDILSEQMAHTAFDRMKIFSWNGLDLRKIVFPLIRCHHRVSELWQRRHEITKKAFTRLAADVHGEIDLLVYLDAADRAGRDETPIRDLDEEAQWLLNKFEELNINRETISPLVMGRDLIKLGVEPGPGMGRILKQLYQLQLDNEFETKKEGIEKAKALIKQQEMQK
jgi:tRNA nucleotidyltransferase (CCA-adding enzyme)